MAGIEARTYLASRIDRRDDGQMGIAVQKKLETVGSRAPDAADPVNLQLTLVAMVPSTFITGRHVVGYHLEHPDGSLAQLVQAPPSEWPAWISAWMDMSGLLPVATDPVPLAPSETEFNPGTDWLALHPLELRFPGVGDYVLRMVIDGERVAQFIYTIEHTYV